MFHLSCFSVQQIEKIEVSVIQLSLEDGKNSQ